MCVCVCVSCVYAGTQGSCKRVLDLLEVEWQVNVTCLAWAVGPEFSERRANSLNSWAISPVQRGEFKNLQRISKKSNWQKCRGSAFPYIIKHSQNSPRCLGAGALTAQNRTYFYLVYRGTINKDWETPKDDRLGYWAAKKVKIKHTVRGRCHLHHLEIIVREDTVKWNGGCEDTGTWCTAAAVHHGNKTAPSK